MENELKLVESKEEREKYITKDYVLDKVKALILLPDNTNVTTEMVANYYEVTEEVIRQLIVRNNDELLSDGLKVLTGKELSDIKSLCQIKSRAKSLTIIPRRAILRIGMLLRDSEIAKQVRTYLLNLEGNSSVDDKINAIELLRENHNHIISLEEKFVLVEGNLEKTLTCVEELMHTNYILNNKISELLNQPLFKINENMSREYEKLMLEFVDVMDEIGIKNKYKTNYSLFNYEFENWTGIKFKTKTNKKQYWIDYYGIEIIKQFIYGIKQGIIIKNKQDMWVSKSGIYTNKVEWSKLLEEFNHSCAYCGVSDKETIMIADHILPQTHNKSTDCIYNIVPCCSECNKSKGINDIKDWYKSQSFFNEQKYKNIKDHWRLHYFKD